MRLESFFEKFDQFADAPNAVAKMRALVLELAVQGKLVEQDSSDEPASVLLEQVRRARYRLAENGKVKTKVHLPTIEADDEPYPIPDTWLFVPLNELTELVYGKLLPTTELLPEGFPVFGANGIIGKYSAYHYEDEMLLISCRGAYSGKPNISPPTCYVTNNSIVCEFFEPKACDIRFYHAVISVSPREKIVTGSAQPQVTVANAIRLPVPLPPLAEQKRIVARVDELMALCDRLEAQQQERQTRHAVLARASLARFADAPTPANLDFLFHKSYDIPPADLRKTILTLAVQGKLVPRESEVPVAPLESILAEASFNGVSKGPTPDTGATEILRISAGTSREDFFVNEDDYKHVALSPDEIEKCRLAPGDLLACRFNGNLRFVGRFSYYRGDSGRVQVNPDKLIRFRVDSQHHCPRYVCYAMNAAPMREAIESMCATTAGNIGLSAGKLKTVELPLPHLAEQHQIVSKVDQLMVLVDQLEAQHGASCAAAEKLMEAIVAELTAQE